MGSVMSVVLFPSHTIREEWGETPAILWVCRQFRHLWNEVTASYFTTLAKPHVRILHAGTENTAGWQSSLSLWWSWKPGERDSASWLSAERDGMLCGRWGELSRWLSTRSAGTLSFSLDVEKLCTPKEVLSLPLHILPNLPAQTRLNFPSTQSRLLRNC